MVNVRHVRAAGPRAAHAQTKRRAVKVRTTRRIHRAALHARLRARRPAHKRFILHPATLLTILFVGVLIVGWTFLVAADSYGITAKVAAPPLTEGAIITEPSDGTVSTTVPITISGSCPDQSYVKLIRNGTFSGVAVCETQTFNIQTTLSTGSNVLQAQDYNVTDDPGPVTTSITVIYNPPAPPTAASSTPSTSSPSKSSQAASSVAPLTLASDYHYQAFLTGSDASWTVAVTGGKTPYTVHVDWNDGHHTDQSQPTASDITLAHRYARPGYYAIKVTITDAGGTSTLLQLAALVKLLGTPLAGLGSTSGSEGGSGSGSLLSDFIRTSAWLWVAWPAYLILVLMAISFWLGERQELRQLLAAQTNRSSRTTKHRPLGHGA